MGHGSAAMTPHHTAMIRLSTPMTPSSSLGEHRLGPDPRATALRYITRAESLCRDLPDGSRSGSPGARRTHPAHTQRRHRTLPQPAGRGAPASTISERQGDPAMPNPAPPCSTLAFQNPCGRRTGVATRIRSARCGRGWRFRSETEQTLTGFAVNQDTCSIGCSGRAVATLSAAARRQCSDSEDKVAKRPGAARSGSGGPATPAWSAT